jgi:membrane associated rhomboid family serine protease
MLDDRDYMREKPNHSFALPPISAYMVILVLNTIVFAAQQLGGPEADAAFRKYGELSLEGLKHGYFWQLLTYQFMHGGAIHFLFNSITLYFCGRVVEYSLGKRSFVALYFLSGLVGGLVQVLLGLVVPTRFGGAVVGASAGLCGIVAAFALVNPQAMFVLFFVLPVKAVYLVPITIAISVFCIIFPVADFIGHAAHLGGTLVGVAWIKFNLHRFFVQLPGESFFEGLLFWKSYQSGQRKRQLVRAASVRSRPWRSSSSESVAELPQEDFISKEVDPILEKISAHGIQSLTERERKILEMARKKMGSR